MTDYEKAGRYLCRAYFSGALKPSASYDPDSFLFTLARCVEKPLESHGSLGGIWCQLLSGDLARLPQNKRARLLGGFKGEWALKKHELSIDGSSGIREYEVALYAIVGHNFLKSLP